ncbi:copper amine oxidase N-terminal domain-containing protein [Paenibacillus sp. J5C_2022]|uniref:copper amine oxidase N-terminal domain-containing protein n=1 Tax=Paenibacillus sp. J5C2022 TaxID=2977129 RepID=UPI0021D2201B|nr:copper amine oxidase N-terminal domain-containing protein [Paenibacillus sp. J5C2022]MCU6709222.1 copper amine oxidase N-terminal domain-containing protein [Paenibacillus sp. J5C2022]
MRKYAVGFIAGALLMTSVTVFAESAKEYILTKLKFPVLVNGKEFKNDDLPFMNYNGNTYVPLKITGDLLGAPVKWNEELKRVEIGTRVPIEKDDIEVLEEYMEDGEHPAIRFKNEIYLSLRDGAREYEVFPIWNDETKSISFENSDVTLFISDKPEINTDGFLYNGISYIKESKFILSHNQVKAVNKKAEDKLLEQQKNDLVKIEKEYPNFKSLFKIEHKTLTTENTVYVHANAHGSSAEDLEDFFEYLNQLGDLKQKLMEKFSVEIQKQNPDYPLDIRFNYYGAYNHFLADITVNMEGTIENAFVMEIANPNPDSSILN